jgi:hypothetical protein
VCYMNSNAHCFCSIQMGNCYSSDKCTQKLPVRHTFDAMHCEKNVCENLLRTLFGETDGAKSHEDMRARGIRQHLHLQRKADGHT